MKKNVLFVMHYPPPIGGQAVMGGFIKDSSLINNSLTGDYVNLSTSKTIEDIGKNGFRKYLTLLNIAFKVFVLLVKNEYDVCYVTPGIRTPSFYKDFVVILIIKLFGLKIIYHLHNRGVSESATSAISRFIYRYSFKNAKVILISKLLYADVANYVAYSDVYFCWNGIPLKDISLELKAAPKNNATVKLLFLSNMMFEKGILVLLEACKILKDNGVAFQCDFVGHWSDITAPAFMQKVEDMGLSNHVFTHGKKYNDEKDTFFADADIFVFPTYFINETFGLVNLEAMQFALPIVTSRIGGVPDVVIDGETGFLTEPKNAVDIANKLTVLIADESLRTRMGIAGRDRFITHFTLAMFERNILQILQHVVKKTD